MQFLLLLGKKLKDDDVVDVLECSDMEVVYHFDRTHENMPDLYWSDSKSEGFQFRFNADQVLDVIFLYAAPIDGFTPLNWKDCDIQFFSSIAGVRSHASQTGIGTTNGSSDLLGVHREWIRLQYDRHTVHYEFREKGLGIVTLRGINRAVTV